jgi:hypothetical protein
MHTISEWSGNVILSKLKDASFKLIISYMVNYGISSTSKHMTTVAHSEVWHIF